MADDGPLSSGINNPMNLLSAVGAGDLNTTLLNGNKILSQLVLAITNLFPRTTGTFTLAAAATTTVTQPAVQSNNIIVLLPTNAAAATLMGSNKSLYVSAKTAGTSFTVATASGVASAGTEQFQYYVVTPI